MSFQPCTKCGANISSKAITCPKCRESNPLNESSYDDINVFVQRGHEHYYQAFIKGKDNKAWGWNWSGFLFGMLWVSYRKMYLRAILLTILSIIPYCRIIVQLACAANGDYWYYKHFVRILQGAPTGEQERLKYLENKGGTSWVGLTIMFMLSGLLIVFLISKGLPIAVLFG